MPHEPSLRAVFCTEGSDRRLVEEIQRFRRYLFVDVLGWGLNVVDGRETDEFDTDRTIHAALLLGNRMIATYRAIRTDQPYLAQQVFPALAVVRAYPAQSDVWEISRFGIAPTADRHIAPINYALMFSLAKAVGATSLVAIADLAYERFLRSLDIRTRRFGPPQAIGTDRHGRVLQGVAGEIAIGLQSPTRLAQLQSLLSDIEITDAAHVFRPSRISA